MEGARGHVVGGYAYRFRATTFDSTDFADDAWLNFRSVQSGLVIDVNACAYANGSKVQQWSSNGADCQRFFPWGTGDGYYQFKVRHSGQVLDNSGCGTANYNPIKTYDQVASQAANDCQQWRVNRLGAGTGVYSFTVLNANKNLDQNCSTAAGSVVFIWDRLDNVCQQFTWVNAPSNGATVQWLGFTVDTTVPGAPAVSSTDYPSDNTWHKGAGQAGAFSFAGPSGATDTAAFVYGLDVTPATEVAATANTATATIIPATDGEHLLNVRTKDRAGNLSPVTSFAFQAGRAGLISPAEGSRVVSRVPLRVSGDPALTYVKFVWRRGPGAASEADIPATNLTKADGTPAGAGFVPLASLGGLATWNVADTLGAAAGVVQIKAVLATDATGAGAYTTGWKTATVDPNADGAATEDLGGGSVNLLTGDFALAATDAQEYGLTATRTSSSRDPRAGYQTQRERLTANQQQITTNTTGFVAPTSTVTRATDRGHSATDSLLVVPAATGTAGTDTFAAVEGDAGALRLGMAAGHTYRMTGWIYVPAATGLAAPSTRGLKLVGLYKTGTTYAEVDSAAPLVTDAWAQLSVDMTVPAGATEAFFRLYNGYAIGSGKQAWFDDLSVRELTAPFGPQWMGGTTADAADTGYLRLGFPDPNVVQLQQVDGSDVWFTKALDGRLFPEPGAEDLSLTFDGTDYRLTELDGTVTVFSKAPAGDTFLVASSSPPAAAASTRYVYENVGDQVRVKRVIGPTEPGIGDCTLATPARGCEALEYEYAASTTATATAFGDVTGQVRRVLAWGTDPATGTVSAVAVTNLTYDDQGRLREVWDPRLPTPIKTTYTYDPAGHVISAAQSGDLPWNYDYGTSAADPNPGRLLKIRRTALAQGSLNTPDGEIATTIVYGVPLTRAAGGPYDLDGPTSATWAQVDVPTDATAVFGPEDPVTTTTATPTSPGADGYRAATVHYLDSAAREVNTATPGGYVDTTEYDRFGNTTRQLDASNRALALTNYPNGAGALADLGLAQYDTATRATWLDTQTVYSADGIDKISELGPLHRIALDADPNEMVNARRHVSTTYDENKPDGAAYHLPTTIQTGGQVIGLAGEQDLKVSTNTYAAVIGGTSGWVLRKPTMITADAQAPAGSLGSLATSQRYDDQGRVRESRNVDSTGTDTGTKLTVYWTAASNTDDATCANRPEWAGQPCVTRAAGAITSADPARMATDLPVKRVTAYSRAGDASAITETAAGKTRTVATTFDAVGRTTSVGITSDAGSAVQTVSTTYDPTTGDATATTMPDGSSVNRLYDALGRITRYSDADGGWTVSEYDRFGKPVRVTDSVGSTQTYTYDRNTEPRGLLTSMTDSVAGTITAQYGPDEQILAELLPGGVKLTNTVDPSGDAVSRVYTRAADGVLIASSSTVSNIRGQVLQQTGPASTKQLTYDRWSRLTVATDVNTGTAACTTRSYSYDRHSNRLGRTVKAGTAGASCPNSSAAVTIAETHTYDSADRITDPGYVYDAFGRTTSLPGGQTNSYYVNDMLAGQQTATDRMSWTLDPILRFRKYTAEKFVGGTWTNAINKVEHYDGDSDVPRWIAEDTAQPNRLTRLVESPEGDLAVTTGQTPADGVTLQLTNLHGDVMATVPVVAGALGVVTVLDADEFGVPDPSTPAMVGTRFGWLGAKERSADTLGGTILMGVRVYQPATGRFLQADPVPGGSANDYDYANADPINQFDLSGQCPTCIIIIDWIIDVIGGAAYSASTHVIADSLANPASRPIVSARIQRLPYISPLQVRTPPRATRNTTNKRKKNYVGRSSVYVIRDGRGRIFKYGITSANPADRRPSSQLRGCARRMHSRCGFQWVGHYSTRQIALDRERSLVIRYRHTHGRCPIGNRERHYGC